MRAVLFCLQADTRDPFAHETGVLPRAHVPHIVVPGREDVIIERATAAFKPGEQGSAGWLNQFELDRTLGFLLHHEGTISYAAARNNVADPDFDHVATAKFAVDGEIEERAISKPSVSIEPKPDSPNLLRLQCTFGTDDAPFVPRAKFLKGRIQR